MDTAAENLEFADITGNARSVSDALNSRHSIRRFDTRPVETEKLEQIFRTSLRTPSWKNSQPWSVHVVTGAKRKRLAELMTAAAVAGNVKPDVAWPTVYPADAKRRMFDLGMKIYGVAGIDRKDKAARDQFMVDNFKFFDAPVAVFITSNFEVNYYVGIDIGCYLQSVMLLAREHGLGTCPQAALSATPDIVRAELGIAEDHKVLVGLSLGYPLPDPELNRFHTPRESFEEKVKFHL
ncbi:MAG: nitroreductase [Spirochaetota bacterium]